MKGITDLDEGTLRRVDWQELIPATILCRAFSATFKASYLLLGAFLIALFAPIFTAIDGKLTEPEKAFFRFSNGPIERLEPNWFQRPLLVGGEIASTAMRLEEEPRRPFVFSASRAAGGVFAVIGVLWFGLAVSRTAVVRLASTSRSSTTRSLKFAARNIMSLFLPIFTPCLFLFGLTLLVATLKKFVFFNVLAAWCAPIFAVVLFALIVLFAITFVAFPLSATAVAAEKSDGFDAVSRGISYATQRPLHLILYSAFAALLTSLGLALVDAVSIPARSLYFQTFNGRDESPLLWNWVRFWNDFLSAIPVAYLGICVVVYSAAIYLALRRSVDGTPFDQYNDDSTGRKTRRLRPILQDAQGAPTISAPVEKSDSPAIDSDDKTKKREDDI